MEDFEKLGAFYLGRCLDLEDNPKEILLYDSRDLLTHAVCVGMTGSGKTGLCLDLIEEAAMDQIPVIAVDPKGDIGNLLLSFPELSASEFLPWVDPDEARRQGLTIEEFASSESRRWRDGLAQWGQDGQRIKRMRETSEFHLYTPGSSAGKPVCLLKSFNAPDRETLADSDLVREQIQATVQSILSLVDIDSDQVSGRENILIANILKFYWQNSKDLELHQLIEAIQNPPFKQVGALPTETFFPAKDRFQLAMILNNLVSSPGFEAWMEGDPLSIQNFFYNQSGKPKVSIFSIAHLSEKERMFFVTALLGQLVSWTRQQSGTASLRALFYMDEIFGYFPPVANPPSKAPLLTLLKQARAFGLGIVLATQNPVDLDYKGLGNAGTWFIGRLQTDRDRLRISEGLAEAFSSKISQADLNRRLSALKSRCFFMRNVHDEVSCVFQTRWTMSYLRGPLSRQDLKRLRQNQDLNIETKAPQEKTSANLDNNEVPEAKAAESYQRAPLLPPEIIARFIPLRRSAPADSELVYKAMVMAQVSLTYSDNRLNAPQTIKCCLLSPINESATPVDWAKAFELKLDSSSLLEKESQTGTFKPLPDSALQSKNYASWSKDLVNYLQANKVLKLYWQKDLKEISQAGENERDFRLRLKQKLAERRDLEKEELRQKFRQKLEALEDRRLRAENKLSKEMAESKSLEFDTAAALGGTLLGAFMGRKVLSSANISRARSAARSASRVAKQGIDLDLAKAELNELEGKMAELENLFQAELKSTEARLDSLTINLEDIIIQVKKSNTIVEYFGLVWAPCFKETSGRITSAW